MGTMIELTAADGHKLGAWRAEPSGKPRGAVVVVMEIFGVNSHIKSVADGYAADGYLAIAPAMFDRVQRDYDTGYTPPEIEAGIAIMQKVDMDKALQDVAAAVAEAKSAGKVGMVGYCWGGTVTWVAASRTDGLSCAAPHYPGGIANFAELEPRVPVMAHFGLQDQSPTPDAAKAVLARHPSVNGYFYPAGHGFNCDQRGSYNADSAALARSRTLEFFRTNLG